MKTTIAILAALIAYCAFLSACTRHASDINGTYMATVSIGEDGKEYTVPVKIERGFVVQVAWPNGGNMNVNDARLEVDDPGAPIPWAIGYNSRGETVTIGGIKGL